MSGDSETRGKEESRREQSVMSDATERLRGLTERSLVALESSFRGWGRRESDYPDLEG